MADSLTQDCFLKAYLAREKFRNDCHIETWLLQIAANLVRDYARSRRLQFWKNTQAHACTLEDVADTVSGSERSPEWHALLNEEIRAVWRVAEHLPERQRTVFLLRFVDDLNLLEIAAATGMKEGTVKVHLHRAVHAVRGQIKAQNAYASFVTAS